MGAAAALLVMGVFEWFSRNIIYIPNPRVFYVLAVACCAFLGGFPSGLAAAVLVCGSVMLSYSRPGQAFHYSLEDAIRLTTVLISAPATAVLVGILKARADRSLAASEARFEALVQTVPYGILLVRGERVEYANPAAARLFRAQTSDELVGLTAQELVHPDYHAIARQRIAELVAGAPHVDLIEERWIACDGAAFDAEVVAGRVELEGGGPGQVVVIRDLSGRKRMQRQIEEQLCELSRLHEADRLRNADLERAVNDRTAQLRRAVEELESFAYSVSHDLRAPLRAICGFAGILSRRHAQALPPGGQKYLGHIRRAGDHMNRLIDDLLNYAKVGRRDITPRRVDLAALLDEVSADLAARAALAGATIDLPEQAPAIASDPTLLRQVLTNLIENAIAYHRPGVPPLVRVTCEREDERLLIRVADNGIGIDAEHHQAIFNIFQRLHAQEDVPGTGIGLAVVKKCVAVLGGQVEVESEPGRGSVFTVCLPAGDVGPATTVARATPEVAHVS
jgi:PAS domain S-box-containing protein